MSVSRRKILQASLGLSQVALLGGLGLLSRPGRAEGIGTGPTRLLTIYVSGGWMPEFFFTPLSADEIDATMPPKQRYRNEPCFFDSGDVANLDGTGDDPHPDNPLWKRIRTPHLWDAQALSAGERDPLGETSPLGWSWVHDNLYERACVLHGIDVGTAAHASGRISMMSGVAGPRYRSPALGAFAAAGLAPAFPHRPLPSVSIGRGLHPEPLSLGPVATPTRLQSEASLAATLSERSDEAWSGLRDRAPHPQHAFDSTPRLETIDTNAIDEFVLRRSRRLFGTVNAGTNAFYEDMYETYSLVSKQLGLDLVTALENTPGWEHFTPTWASPTSGTAPFGVGFGPAQGSDTGAQWNDEFELALKLFKADMCTSASLQVRGHRQFQTSIRTTPKPGTRSSSCRTARFSK